MSQLSLPSDAPTRFPSSQHVHVPPLERKTKMGAIPKYLMDRKIQWAQQRESAEKLKQELMEGGGPGLVALPESERTRMIRGLEMNLELVQKELNKMPITMKTAAHRMRKQELEAKMEALEKSMERLRRPGKIWVQQSDVDDGDFAASLNMTDAMRDVDRVTEKVEQRMKARNPILDASDDKAKAKVAAKREDRQPSQIFASEMEAEENINNWLPSRRR